MQRNSIHPLILTIIGLAIIGLGYRLIVSPGAFITQVLVTVGLVTILVLVLSKFIMPRIMGNRTNYSQSKYQKAARKQQQPIPFKPKSDKKKRSSRPLVKRQSNVRLTVIEGKKNKKKNRALF